MKLINKFVFYKKGEGGLMDFIEELKLQKRKENIKILRKEINEKWVEEKIQNYINDFPFLNYDIKSLKKQILENDLIASFFIKKPNRQNITEKFFASKIKEIEGVNNFINYPSIVKKFLYKGEIIEKKKDLSKSIDYYFDYRGIECYATQKYTKGNGGMQDNQYNDLIHFIDNIRENKNLYIVLIDGSYYTEKKVKKLKEQNKAKNFIVCNFKNLKNELEAYEKRIRTILH